MKLPASIVACLLPFMLTACLHKTTRPQVQTVAPPLKETTPPKPTPTPAELPASAMTIPVPPPPAEITAPPQEIPKPRPKHHKPVAKPTPALQAANGTPGVSAIGLLSSGDPSDLRRETEDSIAATERGLNGVNRRLSDQEQKTAAQIREFIKQARQALTSGDVDGAHTLAVKAKVLLGELSR
jgi:hypothetical protein